MKTLACLAVLVTVSSLALAGDELKTRLIVRLKPGVTAASTAAKYKVAILDSASPFAYFEAGSESKADLVQTAMALDPSVVWAEDEGEVQSPENTGGGRGGTIPSITNDQLNRQYNAAALTQVGWPLTGESMPEAARLVRVAILDTGLSPKAAAVVAKTVKMANTIDKFGWHDLKRLQDTNGDGKVDNMVGHGSMAAGIVSMMSPTARFIIVRTANSDGFATAWSITKALAFAVNQGAEVANLSLGSDQKIPALSDVLDWAVEEKGLLVVASIGNGSDSNALDPAGNSKSICVTGIGSDNRKASFSNWSGDADVAAPALSLRGFHWNGTVASWSGTSFSAPMVTGALAEALSRTKKRVKPDVIQAALKASGASIDDKNPAYKGKVGRRLNLKALHVWLRARGY